jgi:hypothetical protein
MSEETEVNQPPNRLATPPVDRSAQAIRLRVTALYHNCMPSAAFKREDALKEDEQDGAEATALRREACAYEACGQWLWHASKL